MDLTDTDLAQLAEADRRVVDPPIQVQTATWAKAGKLDWWVKERQEWRVGYAGQTAVNAGSELLIFVRRVAHGHDLLGLHSLEAQSVRNADHRLVDRN
jgi:hypothetical protein